MALAASAGIRTLSVTDHDTVAGLAEAADAAARAGVTFVSGIEISALRDATDVHVLGYFFDPEAPILLEFLAEQQEERRRRFELMCRRLAELGSPVDGRAVAAALGASPRAIGRPHLARALVRSGHVASVEEAFDRFLGRGRPAFVERRGVSPAHVVKVISQAGGLASLAHPCHVRRNEWVGEFAAAGLGALEVYHCDHGPDDERRYAELAVRWDLAQTGGSDYHGDGRDDDRSRRIGRVGLPRGEFDRLLATARARRCAVVPAE